MTINNIHSEKSIFKFARNIWSERKYIICICIYICVNNVYGFPILSSKVPFSPKRTFVHHSPGSSSLRCRRRWGAPSLSWSCWAEPTLCGAGCGSQLPIGRSKRFSREQLKKNVLMRAQSAVPSKHAEHTHQELMRTLSTCTSSWRVGLEHTSVPDPYAQGTHQFLMRMLSMFWRDCALCTR